MVVVLFRILMWVNIFRNGRCIPFAELCNGTQSCGDGLNEQDCDRTVFLVPQGAGTAILNKSFEVLSSANPSQAKDVRQSLRNSSFVAAKLNVDPLSFNFSKFLGKLEETRPSVDFSEDAQALKVDNIDKKSVSIVNNESFEFGEPKVRKYYSTVRPLLKRSDSTGSVHRTPIYSTTDSFKVSDPNNLEPSLKNLATDVVPAVSSNLSPFSQIDNKPFFNAKDVAVTSASERSQLPVPRGWQLTAQFMPPFEDFLTTSTSTTTTTASTSTSTSTSTSRADQEPLTQESPNPYPDDADNKLDNTKTLRTQINIRVNSAKISS